MTSRPLPKHGGRKELAEKLKFAPKLMIGNVELKFELEDFDGSYAEVAKEELRETPEVVAEGLKRLRELLKDEPELIVSVDDDDFLSGFLRPCKWYPESSFQLMKRFFQFRLSYPHLCCELLPSKQKAIFKSGVLTPLPRRCNDGARLMLIESGKKWKPREVSLDQMFKGVVLALLAAISEPKTQVAGVRVILDMNGLSLSHVTQFTPSFARAVVDWVQRCIPCRLKGIHVVNQPFIFNMLFAIFKPFLQEKLRRRIHFHGTDRSGILAHIDAKVLPIKYGGDLDIPEEPPGEALWEYFCMFEEDFEVSNMYGYTSKT